MIFNDKAQKLINIFSYIQMVTEPPPGWLAGKPEYFPKAEDHGGVGKNKGREEHDGRFRFWEAGMTKSRRNEKARSSSTRVRSSSTRVKLESSSRYLGTRVASRYS